MDVNSHCKRSSTGKVSIDSRPGSYPMCIELSSHHRRVEMEEVVMSELTPDGNSDVSIDYGRSFGNADLISSTR